MQANNGTFFGSVFAQTVVSAPTKPEVGGSVFRCRIHHVRKAAPFPGRLAGVLRGPFATDGAPHPSRRPTLQKVSQDSLSSWANSPGPFWGPFVCARLSLLFISTPVLGSSRCPRRPHRRAGVRMSRLCPGKPVATPQAKPVGFFSH